MHPQLYSPHRLNFTHNRLSLSGNMLNLLRGKENKHVLSGGGEGKTLVTAFCSRVHLSVNHVTRDADRDGGARGLPPGPEERNRPTGVHREARNAQDGESSGAWPGDAPQQCVVTRLVIAIDTHRFLRRAVARRRAVRFGRRQRGRANFTARRLASAMRRNLSLSIGIT